MLGPLKQRDVPVYKRPKYHDLLLRVSRQQSVQFSASARFQPRFRSGHGPCFAQSLGAVLMTSFTNRLDPRIRAQGSNRLSKSPGQRGFYGARLLFPFPATGIESSRQFGSTAFKALDGFRQADPFRFQRLNAVITLVTTTLDVLDTFGQSYSLSFQCFNELPIFGGTPF